MRIFTYILVLIIIFIGITFAILNSDKVTVNYYVGLTTMPLSFVIVIAFVSGTLIGMIVGFCLLLKSKVKNYRLRQRLNLAEKEIENLRAIPLQDKV